MRNIVLKWLGISVGISLIPVVILGASPGGIALSPLILLLGVIIGLLGATIHINIYAFKVGKTGQKYKAAGFGFIAILLVVGVVLDSSRCGLDEGYARERVANYINKKTELSIQYIGLGTYDSLQCKYSVPYTDPANKFTFIVSSHGKLHFSRE